MNADRLTHAVALARAGEKDAARQILLKVLQEEPANEKAWVWLADSMPTDTQRIAVLKQCLKNIPESQTARRALAALQASAARQAEEPTLDDMMGRIVERAEKHGVPEKRPAVAGQPRPEIPAEELLDNLRSASVGSQRRKEPLKRDAVKKNVKEMDRPGAADLAGERKPPRWRMAILLVLSILLFAAILITALVSPRSPLRGIFLPVSPSATFFSGELPLEETSTIVPGGTALSGFQPAQRTATVAAEAAMQTEAAETLQAVTPTPGPPTILLGAAQARVDWIGWSPDGGSVGVASPGGVSLYRPEDLGLNRYLSGTQARVQCQFSADGARLACGGDGVTVWGLSDGERLQFLDLPGTEDEKVTALALSGPDGLAAAAYDLPEPSIRFWSLGDGSLQRISFPLEAEALRMAFSTDAVLLAAGLADGSLLLLDPNSQDSRTLLEGSGTGLAAFSFTPDGVQLAWASEARVIFWDLDEEAESGSLDAGGPVHSMAFSSDGAWLAVGVQDGEVEVWDMGEQTLAARLHYVDRPVKHLAFSPDGSGLALGYESGAVSVLMDWMSEQ